MFIDESINPILQQDIHDDFIFVVTITAHTKDTVLWGDSLFFTLGFEVWVMVKLIQLLKAIEVEYSCSRFGDQDIKLRVCLLMRLLLFRL